MKKILILTSNVGNGHISIAKAYDQIIRDNLPSADVLTLNTSMSQVSWGYRLITSYFGKPYLKIYNWTNNEKSAVLLHKIHTTLTFGKVKRVIKSFSPDLIISTNSFSSSPAHKALKALKMNAPIIVVIADPFSIHSVWTAYQKADLYIAPTLTAKNLLIKNGITENRIATTGWPVRKEFYKPTKFKKTESKIHILITSGGEGLSYIKNYILKVLQDKRIKNHFLFDVICGKNKELYKALGILERNNPTTLKVYKFVDDIHKLMFKADYVVGKPGPNFLFEAITLAKPFIAIGIPIGQELGNYHFLAKNGIGFWCKDPKQFKQLLLKIMDNKQKLNISKLKRLNRTQSKAPTEIWLNLMKFLN